MPLYGERVNLVCLWYVEFYVSAVGSYHIRPMLAGMTMTCDEAHRDVLAALDSRERAAGG